MDRLRRMVTRHHHKKAAGARNPTADWRAMLKRRVGVTAVLLGLWVVGIEARFAH